MNTEPKDRIGKIALIIGLLMLLSAGIILAVHLIQKNKQRKLDSQDHSIPEKAVSTSAGQTLSSQSALIKKMQSYLLNLGINYNNHIIIDAIRLTGGIDGIEGDGFRLALQEAIKNGYIESRTALEALVS